MDKTKREHLVQRFEDWWRRDNRGLPLMRVVARRDDADAPPAPDAADDQALYTDAGYLTAAMRHQIGTRVFMADAFPSLGANLGPGSLALYLGSEPIFRRDTVWYAPCISDPLTHPPLRFDPDNRWWKLHYDLVRELKASSRAQWRLDIPDLIENIDIYAAMRGPQETLFDIMDCPEAVHGFIRDIDAVYFRYYDAMLSLVQDEDGVSSYTAFSILGKGRVAKIQCDFSAMLSPEHFREFVLPSLEAQTRRLDHALYHLDGPDAIRHVPALMELQRLQALQWTCGAGQPDGACPRWYPIYDQVVKADKGLWIQLYDGGVDDWIRGAEELMSRYGKRRFYFLFPEMSLTDADRLMNHAEKNWTTD
ncbi:MAG: trimethylamine corrinoid protein 2 [Clostridia bacterium]|nr:trimethylamine corrinoid protein 2 [Clostridia bacterium]